MIKKDIKLLSNTGFFYIFIGSVLNKIVTFFSSVAIVHVLTKTEYGTFTYAWNIYSFILLINGLGLSQGVLQIGSEFWNNKECENIFLYAIKKGVIFDLFIALLMLFVSYFTPIASEGVRHLLAIMCLLPLVQFINDIMTIYLRVKRKNKLYAVLNFSATVLVFTFSVLGAILLREKGLVLGRYVAWGLTIILGLFFLGAKLELYDKKKISKDVKGSVVKVSTVSMANNGISQLLYLLDIFVLGIVASDEEILANYKVATTIPTALLFIPSAIVTYIYPYFAAHANNKKWCLKNYKKLFLANILLNGIIFIILFSFAPLIIRIVFGERYLDAIPIFRLLSISYLISATFRIISSNLLVMMRKLRFNFCEAIFSGIINIVADFVLIKWYGSIGAAVATIIVVTFSGIASTFYLLYTYRH